MKFERTLRYLMAIATVGAFGLLPVATHATIYVFDANLNGPSESPPNASPGTGFG